MTAQTVGNKAKAFEPRNLAFYFPTRLWVLTSDHVGICRHLRPESARQPFRSSPFSLVACRPASGTYSR